MQAKQILLSLALVPCFLVSCNNKSSTGSSYTLTFYQPHGNHSDDYTVNIGKTTLDEIKTYANGLKDYSKAGYDRNWDWDNYDFANQKEDWTITAINPLHNYKISFQHEGVEKGSTTYTIKDSDYTVPTITPEQKGFEYIEKEHLSIEGKKEDLVSELDLQRCEYKMRFFVSDDDPNPTEVKYNFDNPSVKAPKGPEGYDSTWSTKDSAISFNAGETKNIKTVYGEDKLGNYDLYLNKEGITYTITLNENGGVLSESKTMEIKHGDPYTLPTPKFINNSKEIASFLGWFDSNGEQVPTSGDSFPVVGNQTLIARYFADFENNDQLGFVTAGSRSAMSSSELDTTDKTFGLNSAKLGAIQNTFSCMFNKEFVESCFADPTVVAINFDAKGAINWQKLSCQNYDDASHVYENCNSCNGYGLTTTFKKFSYTREMYNAAKADTTANGKPYEFVWAIGTYTGGYIWIDNVRPTSEPLTPYGFENCTYIPEDKSVEFKTKISYRNTEYKEVFVADPQSTNNSNIGFDYDVKSEGCRSIRIHKDTNVYIPFFLPQAGGTSAYKQLIFDLYFTCDLNGNTLKKGNNNPLIPLTTVLAKDTWYTFTLNRDEITADNRFLIVQGSATCDFYFDNIRFVK